MSNVYIPNIVEGLISFYDPILSRKLDYGSIADQITALGTHAYDSFQKGDHRSLVEFNNYNPSYIGKQIDEIIALNPDKTAFLNTTANTFGYKDYESAKTHGDIQIDEDFEKAVDYLLAGNLEQLKSIISEVPDLISRKSQYPHQASLIHYVGSNGVEFWRQVVPDNLVEILEWLLKIGCNPDQENMIYGGSTLKGLIASSAHPYAAGIAEQLLELL